MNTTELEICPDCPEIEEARVTRWRFEEFARAGYDVISASTLASRKDVDLHLALDLLERGCPLETALRILL